MVEVDGRKVKSWLRWLMPGLIAAASAAAVVLGSVHGYRFLMTSGRFAVQVIEVRGNDAVATEAVLGRLGVREGENIFALALGDLAAAVESDPTIARAQVRRQLPDTLLVDIEENEAAALVELGGLYLADQEGVVFKRAVLEDGDGEGLPVITGLSRSEYADDPETVRAQIREALAAAAIYESGEAEDRPALGEIHVHPRHGLIFTTYERAVAVRVGRGDPDILRARLHTFDVAWQALSVEEQLQARIVYADASTRPDRVTVGFEHIE